MSLKDEFATRNFSIYGQWLGILSMILCFALGIANLFNLFGHFLLIIFSILALISCFIILFVEVPLLLRICPTSASFDAAIRRVSTNYMRAAAYGVMAAVQWISIAVAVSSLIAAAVVLTFTALCYALAGVKGQAFVGSKTLGGAGVAQMIV
ncbi:Golgi apparatus membrane protein TVP18 [Annulohypoxylon truncatum]|uniref:Golgi apparatus membrane protein TVP18 n=1 Tax=Annulohypoxylon truncatum TaxID=327061 RepID=UPI002008AD82|nr:Golgi apparatus membrane protein TVP18 [Annulohypoxylon truncatum]KAI1205027.1 Golgi apparatus membrane protein TVP18 [Annulohypoxylon truncatum]